MSIIVKLLTAVSIATASSIVVAGLYMFACYILINYFKYNYGKENYWVLSHCFVVLMVSWVLVFGVFFVAMDSPRM